MARTPRYTVKQVEAALRAGAGIITAAAGALKCAPSTVRGYLERNPKLKEVCEDIVEQNLDLAEGKLLMGIRESNMTAIIFYLKTKGRSRGYTERHELATGADGRMKVQVYLPEKDPE